MAESINDLLDENQKAAELLTQHVQSARHMVEQLKDHFITRMNYEVFAGSMKNCAEAIKKQKEAAEEWKTKFEEHSSAMVDHINTLQENAEGVAERVQEIETELKHSADELESKLDSLRSITNAKFEESDPHEDSIFGFVTNYQEQWQEKHQTQGALLVELVEQIAKMKEEDDAAERHESAIEQLGQHLQEHTEELRSAFQEIAMVHQEKEEELGEMTDLAVTGIGQALKDIFAEHLPEVMNTSSEELVGTLSGFMDTVTEGHEKVSNGLEDLVEKITEIMEAANHAQPWMAAVRNIR